VGWLAGLLTVPMEAGEDALSKTVPDAATNGADKATKDHRLPDEGVSAEEAQAREELTAVTSGLVNTSYPAQLQEGNLGGPVTEVRGQLSTPRATDPSEATKKLPPVTEQGQPQLNAIAELGLGQPVAARQATMTTAPASSKVGEEIRPASMAPTEHADALARPHPYRPSQAAVRPTVPMEETSKPRVGQEAVNKPEQVAAGPQAIVKPFHQEPSNSQPQQGINPVFSNQGTRETLPSAPSASLARLESVIQPSVHSPAFAPAFSARIATLARDGLELARVHLNPVDMGPVSVQLSLEGQQVRVDMTADVAATRRVLEQALPTLAGALREAGFTLSGGGVHQPPTDARHGSSQDAGANSSSNPQGTGTPDNLSSSAGGAGGQGTAANPFREAPQNQGAFTNSRQLTVGEENALSATGTPAGLEGRPATGLVDVFA
jgi:flagellar hook-length control protein FliK